MTNPDPITNADLDNIRAEAIRLGFSFTDFVKIERTPHFEKYLSDIKKGHYGNLNFLKQPYVIEGRRDPQSLLEGGKTAIVLGMPYGPIQKERSTLSQDKAIISIHAIYPDYHKMIKKKAQTLIGKWEKISGEPIRHRIFIDSGPVMEKDFAFLTGFGGIGKNSLFIHSQLGSFLYLCVIFINLDLDVDTKRSIDLCANCTICINACPTGCIRNDRTLKINECISYLTIEHKGTIPDNLRSKIGTRVFGCDVCQDVCPYNLKATNTIKIEPILDASINISNALNMTKETFDEQYQGTVIARLEYEHFMRNILITAGNNGNALHIPLISRVSKSGSDIIQEHAKWALSQLNNRT